ncbi:MAG: lamin tail domain-containing protein [Planctomycetota bacterium]
MPRFQGRLASAALVFLFQPAPANADCLLITELVTDPQADHSENTGGNGVPFDDVPGTGTVSSLDEYVEIFNASGYVVDLTGFRLEFYDATPSSFVFGTSTGVVRISLGSTLDSLLPGAFALVGNPPGALNNRITVLLRDPGGGVVDSLIDVDGNATGASDEALYRPWTGDRFLDDPILGPITPLGFPPAVRPVPEPATLVMVCVSGFSAALASVRRARCARRRKRHAVPRSPTPTT